MHPAGYATRPCPFIRGQRKRFRVKGVRPDVAADDRQALGQLLR
jgi:hypothetical protein